MSYFLTIPEALKHFETALVELVRDLRPGSVVMLLGAPGHEPIHREMETIMDAGHFRRLLHVPEQLETPRELEVMLKGSELNESAFMQETCHDLLHDHDRMGIMTVMSASDDRLLESEVRKANWVPGRYSKLQPSR
jgi:hypothetical protein